MNTFLPLTKSLHCLNPVILMFPNFVASVLTWTLKLSVSSLPPLFTPNVTTVTLCATIFLTLKLYQLQQIQNSLAGAVVKAPKFMHIIPILKSLA